VLGNPVDGVKRPATNGNEAARQHSVTRKPGWEHIDLTGDYANGPARLCDSAEQLFRLVRRYDQNPRILLL
jgi:hypothetical protein